MKTKVSEIAVLNAGPKKYKGVFPTIQYLDTSSVDQGKILEFQLLDVERDVIPSRAQRAVKDGTIVISSVRPNLKHYAFLKNPAENVVVSSGFVTVDALPERVDSKFLYYALTSSQATKYLDSIASTAVSAYPSFNPEDLGNYVVEIPDSLDKQREIARVLSSIDEKIENNNAICSNLEAMAKLLYDYWFVQFDFPDENGNPYKSSGGKMVWNDELKREIPAGWEVKCVSDIGTLEQNSVWPNDGMVYSHYSIPAFDDSHMPVREEGSVIESNKYLISENCVLVSKLNPQFKRIWLIIKPQENAICSTEFLPIKASDVGINYLYEVVNSDAFSVHLSQKASSSTGSRKRIDPENCMAFQFASDNRIAKLYNSKIASLIEQANQIPLENQQLASLRDFLLPMLMNGQVKVG